MEASEWAKLFLDFVQTAAIVIGGLYALYEYRRTRRFRPKLQFEIDFELYPIEDRPDTYLLNIDLIVMNKGAVRKKIPKLLLRVKTLNAGDVENGLSTQKRFEFGRELIPRHNTIYDPKDPYWVDPGVTQILTYPVVIKEPNSFVQVNATLYYYKTFFGRLFSIKKDQKHQTEYHMASLVKPVTG
jgi:hypothetical protein